MKRRAEATEVFRELDGLLAAGRSGAVAMVVSAAGSAYRRPGARMLVAGDGRTWGGISAGCLEEDVRLHALDALAEGRPRLLGYDTSGTEAEGLGLGCDGRIEVLVRPFEPGERRIVAGAMAALENGRRLAIAWSLADDGGIALVAGDPTETVGPATSSPLPELALEALDADGCRLVDRGGSRVFTEALEPPPGLLIFGGGQDAEPLAALAGSIGFAVTVADHRPGNLDRDGYPPTVRLVRARPGEAGTALQPAPSDMVIIKTHSFEHDLAWLRRALASGAGYVGLMGPHSRIQRLKDGTQDDPRIYGPVGLDLGARGAEQIAVAVVAELLAVRSGRAPRHLRDRDRPIHSDHRPADTTASRTPASRSERPPAGIVLAAGASRRMGTDKRALELAGETLLGRCIRIGREAGLDPIVVVVPAGEEGAQREGPSTDGVIRATVPAGEPPSQQASLRAGLVALPDGADPVAILLADMPFVTPELVRTLADLRHEQDAAAVQRDGRPAPPMVVRRAVLQRMVEAGDRRHLLESLGAGLRTVEVPAEALTDVDTPRDYARVTRQAPTPPDAGHARLTPGA